MGVSRQAGQDEIKRAYRKLAHRHHPDKAGKNSEAKFKEINEAYQVLSDPRKRAQYDQFGAAAGPGGFDYDFGGRGATWDFRDFGGFGFGGLGDIFETVFSQAFSQVQTEIAISLTQALLGDKIQLKTAYGDIINLNIPAGTQDGTTFRFSGKGQPNRRGRGDLLVTIKIQIPRRLTREQKELLEQLKQTGL